MTRRITVIVICALSIGGTTAVGIAGKAGGGGGNAAVAQYSPSGEGEKNGRKTCAALVRHNRSALRNLVVRHRRALRNVHGRARRQLARTFRRDERILRAGNVRIERDCRKRGGSKVVG
jgi:hypothetical protein